MEKRPNIILIQTDQQYAGTLACYGNPVTDNPTIQAMAEGGMVFERAYCNYPACVPSRASMMSGRYPHTIRSHANFQHLNPQEMSLPEALRRAGYTTALIGKNHAFMDGGKHGVNGYPDSWNGDVREPNCDHLHQVFDEVHEASHVFIEGFDGDPEVVGSVKWAAENIWGSQHAHGANPYPKEKCITYLLGQQAEQYIREKSAGEAPFFLWLSFPDPHTPYQAPEPYASMYPPEGVPAPIRDGLENKPERHRVTSLMDHFQDYDERHYRTLRAMHYGMIRFIDDSLARVMDSLERAGIVDDTILVFTSDHGDAMGDHGLIQKHNFFYDSFTHVPLIIRWGNRFAGRRCASPIELVDIMPTVMELAGVPIPFGVQGKSFAGYLMQGQKAPRRYAVIESGEAGQPLSLAEVEADDCALLKRSKFAFCALPRAWHGQGKCIFDGRYKLCVYATCEGELYDMEKDPTELCNLYGREEYRDIETELKYRLLLWCMESEDPIPQNKTGWA